MKKNTNNSFDKIWSSIFNSDGYIIYEKLNNIDVNRVGFFDKSTIFQELLNNNKMFSTDKLENKNLYLKIISDNLVDLDYKNIKGLCVFDFLVFNEDINTYLTKKDVLMCLDKQKNPILSNINHFDWGFVRCLLRKLDINTWSEKEQLFFLNKFDFDTHHIGSDNRMSAAEFLMEGEFFLEYKDKISQLIFDYAFGNYAKINPYVSTQNLQYNIMKEVISELLSIRNKKDIDENNIIIHDNIYKLVKFKQQNQKNIFADINVIHKENNTLLTTYIDSLRKNKTGYYSKTILFDLLDWGADPNIEIYKIDNKKKSNLFSYAQASGVGDLFNTLMKEYNIIVQKKKLNNFSNIKEKPKRIIL